MAMVGLRASYHRILGRIEHMLPAKLRPFYNHPAGPKTVFFWAPMFKWGLVLAGLADMARPAEKLSTSQSAVLTATGIYHISFYKYAYSEVPNLPHSLFFRSYLVQVFPGYYTQELESVCCKLLCWRCRRLTALQNMAV